MALNDFDTMEHELTFFLGEDPTNALAPVARQNLAALTHNKEVRAAGRSSYATGNNRIRFTAIQTFPNSDQIESAAELPWAMNPMQETCERLRRLGRGESRPIRPANGAARMCPALRPVALAASGQFGRVWTMWPCFSPSAATGTW